MFAAFLGLSLVGQSVTLSYREGAFLISGSETLRVPIAITSPSRAQTLFHDKDQWIVWDRRGLTIRKGAALYSTKMIEYPVSPKVLNRDSILHNAAMISSGERRREASGIAGWQRIGSDFFLLARWENSRGIPWLEVLVKIPMSEARPKPTFVGKLSGLSLGPLDGTDRLRFADGLLKAFVKRDPQWGLSTFDLTGNAPQFHPLGENLVSPPIAIGEEVLAIERTSYGSLLLSKLHPQTSTKMLLTEARGRITILSLKGPIIRIDLPQVIAIRSIDTGAELRLPKGLAMLATTRGLLVWAPITRPERATLFSTTNWTPIAAWKKTSQSMAASMPGLKQAADSRYERSGTQRRQPGKRVDRPRPKSSGSDQ